MDCRVKPGNDQKETLAQVNAYARRRGPKSYLLDSRFRGNERRMDHRRWKRRENEPLRAGQSPAQRARESPRRLAASAAAVTPIATTAIMMVQIALISGFTPSRTCE